MLYSYILYAHFIQGLYGLCSGSGQGQNNFIFNGYQKLKNCIKSKINYFFNYFFKKNE